MYAARVGVASVGCRSRMGLVAPAALPPDNSPITATATARSGLTFHKVTGPQGELVADDLVTVTYVSADALTTAQLAWRVDTAPDDEATDGMVRWLWADTMTPDAEDQELEFVVTSIVPGTATPGAPTGACTEVYITPNITDPDETASRYLSFWTQRPTPTVIPAFQAGDLISTNSEALLHARDALPTLNPNVFHEIAWFIYETWP